MRSRGNGGRGERGFAPLPRGGGGGQAFAGAGRAGAGLNRIRSTTFRNCPPCRAARPRRRSAPPYHPPLSGREQPRRRFRAAIRREIRIMSIGGGKRTDRYRLVQGRCFKWTRIGAGVVGMVSRPAEERLLSLRILYAAVGTSGVIVPRIVEKPEGAGGGGATAMPAVVS